MRDSRVARAIAALRGGRAVAVEATKSLTILAVETAYAPAVWLQLAVWLPVTLFPSLALLQPTKGAIVGLQWQIGMHGFEASKQRREAIELAPVLVKADTRAA